MLLICRTQQKLQPTLNWFEAQNIPTLGFAISTAQPITQAMPKEASGIILTSSSALLGLCIRDIPQDIPVYTVGEATAAAAKDAGLNVVYSGVNNGQTMATNMLNLKNVPKVLWHPRATNAGTKWHTVLEEGGYTILTDTCYQTHYCPTLPPEVLAALNAGKIRAVAAYSPKAAGCWQSLIHKNAPGGLKIPTFAFSPAVAERLDLVHNVYVCKTPTNQAIKHLWNEQQKNT